jgi:hypothetical protein
MIKQTAIYLLGFSDSGLKSNIDPRASLFVIFVLLVCLIAFDKKNGYQKTKDRF